MSNVSLRILLVLFSVGVMIAGLSLVMCAPAYSNSLGVGFSNSVDGDLDIALQGEYESDNLDFEASYQGTDLHDIKLNLTIRHSFGWFDASLFQENDLTGYDLKLSDMNRESDLGISGIIPIGDVDLIVSVFQRNGNVASTVQKFDTDTGELVSTTPGLTPLDGVHTNIAGAVSFDVRDFEIKAKGLTNFKENPTPQWLIDASTTGEQWGITWQLSALYKGQYLESRLLQNEFSSMLTFGINF